MQALKHSRLYLAQHIVLAGLLLCMALAQSLSFAHRTLHHDVRMLAHAHQEVHADVHGHGADCDHGAFSRLFASHEEGDEACRLIDGASGFLGFNSLIPGILPALYAHVLIAFDAAAMAAWQAPLFEARGPPSLSL